MIPSSSFLFYHYTNVCLFNALLLICAMLFEKGEREARNAFSRPMGFSTVFLDKTDGHSSYIFIIPLTALLMNKLLVY